jgi:hypothetical protein
MIEAAVKEMAEIGWGGIEIRAFNGSFHHKAPDGKVSCEAPFRAIKEWSVTFFYIINPGLTTVKAIGKGKTLAEAISKAKENAYAREQCGD